MICFLRCFLYDEERRVSVHQFRYNLTRVLSLLEFMFTQHGQSFDSCVNNIYIYIYIYIYRYLFTA